MTRSATAYQARRHPVAASLTLLILSPFIVATGAVVLGFLMLGAILTTIITTGRKT